MTEEQGERIIALLERIAAAVEMQTWKANGDLRSYLWNDIPVMVDLPIVVQAAKRVPAESEQPS